MSENFDKNLKKLEEEYDVVNIESGWFVVKKGNKCGVVRFDRGWKREVMFDEVQMIVDSSKWKYNLFCVEKAGKWGYIDSEGQQVIPCENTSKFEICELVDNVLNMLNYELNSDDEENIKFYAKDKNFYRVLLWAMRDRYQTALQTRDKTLASKLIEDLKFKIREIVCLIKNSKNKSYISTAGINALMDFYADNLNSFNQTL